MLFESILALATASLATAQTNLGPVCSILAQVVDILSSHDVGLLYCSTILRVGTLSPILATTMSSLIVTAPQATLSQTTVVSVLAGAVISYITLPAQTIIVASPLS